MDGLIAYALSKKYVDGKTSSLATGMSWKGTKENVSSLPQSGNKIGDLWHVNENGNEYAWDGSKWEALGGLDKSFTETDPTVPEWAKQPQKPTYTAAEVGALPSSTFIPTKVSDLQNDSGFITSAPISSVNGKTGVVNLNASDVGALPSDTLIPPTVTETTVSQWGFTKNTGTYSKPDGGIPKTDLAEAVQTSLGKADTALQSHQSLSAYRTASAQDTIDEAQDTAIAAKYTKPSTGIPKTDLAAAVQASLDKADTALQSHQSLSGYATEQWVESKGYLTQHQDISGKADASDVAALVSRLNAIADSDDTTLDQLSEIVAYIKNNKSLIDNITTGKISVSDIVDNLTSSATNKPLSANQGRALKALIDAIVVPTESTVSGWGFTKNTGTYSKPSGGIPKTDLAETVQTSLGKADTALQSHQSLAAYRTASAQDTIDNAQNAAIARKANTADLSNVAFSGDYNDLQNRPDDDYIFADEIPQNADHSSKYVLPDGYIYVYGEHTYHRVYNAATDGQLNKVPVQNQNVETTGDKAGAFLSAPIPWDSSWTQYEKTPTVVRITGNKTLSPIWYNSAIQVFYYKANGDFKFSLGQSAIHSFVGGAPSAGASIPLPCEFNLADNNYYPLEDTGYVRIYLGVSADGTITADDVKGIVINVPFYDSDVTATEWYNSGERYMSDPQVEQNTEDIAALDARVTALEEDSGSGGGITVNTNQVLYAVGDSITRGAVAGGEEYAWPKHVIDINGYDATNSRNLGQNGLGFDTAATSSGDTIRDIVDRTDFSAADIVTVALGCNDWDNSNARLANVWANMEYCFNKIRTDNPYCKLFYILPFNMSFGGTFNTFYCLSFKGDSNPLCPYSYTLMQYINMIKDKLATPTFQAFHINVIDMVECAAINRQNITTALADQVHPTAATQVELGKEIARRIVLADGAGGVLPVYTGGVS